MASQSTWQQKAKHTHTHTVIDVEQVVLQRSAPPLQGTSPLRRLTLRPSSCNSPSAVREGESKPSA
eukprot:2629179-Amphidinium_carterae.1